MIGLVHIAGAGAGLAFVLVRGRASHLMDNTADAVNRGFAALEGLAPHPVESSLEQDHAP